MAEPRSSSDSSVSIAAVAIVVLVIVALLAGYFLFFQGGTGQPSQPDIQIQLDNPATD